MHESKRARFKSALLGILLDQSHIAALAAMINSVLYTLLSWQKVPSWQLICWLVAVFGLSGARTLVVRQVRLRLPRCQEKDLDIWGNRVRSIILVSAGLWGIMGGVLLVPSDSAHLTFTAFLLAGMTAGAVGAYSAHLRIIFPMVGTMLAPFALRLAYEGGELQVMAFMAALFIVLMGLVGKNIHRQTVRSVELGLENEELVQRLNDASHEIRTPVSAIAGFAEVLRDHSEASPAVREYASIIFRNSQYLRKLVDNVLLFSRSRADLIGDSVETTNIRDELQLAIEVVIRKIREKGLSLKVDIAPQVPERLPLYTLKFQQILINLLSNASKFTNQGEIVVDVDLQGRHLTVRVRDTGIGMDPASCDFVFEPFWRENRTEVKREEGSGLGLTLSRELARNWGGDLVLIMTAPGQGSVFELRVPVLDGPVPFVPGATAYKHESGRQNPNWH